MEVETEFLKKDTKMLIIKEILDEFTHINTSNSCGSKGTIMTVEKNQVSVGEKIPYFAVYNMHPHFLAQMFK